MAGQHQNTGEYNIGLSYSFPISFHEQLQKEANEYNGAVRSARAMYLIRLGRQAEATGMQLKDTGSAAEARQ